MQTHNIDAMEYASGYTFSKEHQFDVESVRTFARLVGDSNPLHHDAAAARATRFGALIVSGTHTSALLLALTADHFSARGSVVGLGFEIQFTNAIPADARVVMRWEVLQARVRSGKAGQVLDLRGSVRGLDGTVYAKAAGQFLVGAQL